MVTCDIRVVNAGCSFTFSIKCVDGSLAGLCDLSVAYAILSQLYKYQINPSILAFIFHFQIHTITVLKFLNNYTITISTRFPYTFNSCSGNIWLETFTNLIMLINDDS